MNKIKKAIRSCIAILFVYVMALQLISCNKTAYDTNESSTLQATVIEIEKYGHAVLDITTADFMKNGYSLNDIRLFSISILWQCCFM